jgi:hypothetical protein
VTTDRGTAGRAFATVDRGTASVAVALVGRVQGRWRLLGASSAPAAVGAEPLIARLVARVTAADRGVAEACGLDRAGAWATLPRVETGTAEPPTMVVLGATDGAVASLEAVAATSGWRTRPIAIAGADILAVASALSDPQVTAVLAGVSDPPGGDERPLIGELAVLVAAATQRRPDLGVVLAGALALPGGPAETSIAADRPGATLLGPAPARGDGARLRALLDGIRSGGPDGRRALVTATETLAEVLGRRIEVVDIGRSGGARVSAGWPSDGIAPVARSAFVAAAALVPPAMDERLVDEVAGWLTVPLDRLRLQDRLHDLAVNPWGDAAGDGARLRMAAARAALGRLVATTPGHEALPAPELLVAAGGVWSVAPGPAVALALADSVRRPGVRALGLDHARLLGPLGAIVDPAERREVMADLRDTLLVPLGSVVMPAGIRPGRAAGRLAVEGSGGSVEIELRAGALELVDLPPGDVAIVEASFREPVDLGSQARRIAVEVAGGLGGLIVDLRDIPMRLPDRPERRRDLLAEWQAALWAGVDA